MKADFVVYDRHSQIVLIAELPVLSGRPNGDVIYFLMEICLRQNFFALLDRFSLWKDAGNTPDSGAPTFEIDTQPILKPIVATWLNSI